MNDPQRLNSTRVLVIEDNPVDVRLIRYALSRNESWPTEITVADDGEKALAMLAAGPLPDFVILDLNLPKINGAEVLLWVRKQQDIGDLPVAILSSSPLDEIHMVVSGARVQANGYFTKPMEVDHWESLARELEHCYRSTRSKPTASGS